MNSPRPATLKTVWWILSDNGKNHATTQGHGMNLSLCGHAYSAVFGYAPYEGFPLCSFCEKILTRMILEGTVDVR